MSRRFVLALALISYGGSFGFAQVSTTRVSVASDGSQSDGDSATPSLSADGRFALFSSGASNLVPGDANACSDVFLHDRVSRITTRVSVNHLGGESDGESWLPALSSSGRYASFCSKASNLVPGDVNGLQDVFVRDLQVGTTRLVSVDPGGNGADGPSVFSGPSADGRFIAFDSLATNLVAGDTNGRRDVFVRDTLLRTTRRVSLSSSGTEADHDSYAPMLSADGRYTVYSSLADNLVPADLNHTVDVFRTDIVTGRTLRVSVSSNGGEGDLDSGASSRPQGLSADGESIAFVSAARNLVPGDTNQTHDVFVRDVRAQITTRVSVSSAGAQGNGPSSMPAISPDGRFVAFLSLATNLVAGDSNGFADVFVFDRESQVVRRASVSTAGFEGDADSEQPGVSANRTAVVFCSNADNLVAMDTNLVQDVFVRELQCAPVESYCTAKVNSLGCTPTFAWSGIPQSSTASGFHLRGESVANHKPGLLFYGLQGKAVIAFQGAYLCVLPPVSRTPVVDSAGSALPANDCSGVFELDFNRFAAGLGGGHPDPALALPGTSVNGQWWGRDPGFTPPFDSTLSDAVEFVMCAP